MTPSPTTPTSDRILWSPNPGPQAQFLASTAYEVLYGGQAGGGKSAALIAMPLRWATHPGSTRLCCAANPPSSATCCARPGGSGRPFRSPTSTAPRIGGRSRPVPPCGSTTAKEENDKYDYQGDEFALVGFDELTHFSRSQYLEIATRIRAASPGLPRYLRARRTLAALGTSGCSSVGGMAQPGLREPRGWPFGERPAVGDCHPRVPEILWVTRRGGRDIYVPRGTPRARSRQFIPAALKDNPVLCKEDRTTNCASTTSIRSDAPSSGRRLAHQAERRRLPFKREWVTWLDVPPADLRWVRAWDLAATPKTDHNDPAWTAGVKMAVGPPRRRGLRGRRRAPYPRRSR